MARIAQLVRQLVSEHPDWQKKQLAFEAWALPGPHLLRTSYRRWRPSNAAWSKFWTVAPGKVASRPDECLY